MSGLPKPPHSPQTEWSVVSQMLAKPNVIGEVIGAQVEPEDFYSQDCRQLYEAIVTAHYADQRIDALTMAEALRFQLSNLWSCEESEVSDRLYQRQLAATMNSDAAADHAILLRQMGDKRRLQALCLQAIHAIEDGSMSSEEVGDYLTTEGAKITTGAVARGEILSWVDTGREYVKYLKRLKLAKERGVELSAYTGLKFIDHYTKGLGPGELMMCAGEPGVGKSAVVWVAAEGFARRQMFKEANRRIGTLVLSLEMGLVPSSTRLAQTMTKLDGGRLREGEVSDEEVDKVVQGFLRYKDLPMFFNFASNFRASQMRALIVDAIRRHNIGLVVLDHFRMFDLDRRVHNPNQEEELKARFLKESIAKDLNVAVVCLAHTIKLKREGSDGRPTLSDLRGSGQVAAHCDIVNFIYRPYMYASQHEIEDGHAPDPTAAEMIWSKNRNGELGTSYFYFNPAEMQVRDNW